LRCDLTLEQVEDVRTHRRHAGTAADEDHLVIRIAGEKLAERTVDRNLVARFQVEHEGGHLARRDIVAIRRWRGDADVELDDALFIRVVGHRVGADHRLIDLGDIAPHVELVPVAAVFLLDVEILVVGDVRRAFELDVAAGAEVDALAFRQTQRQFLDEGGDVRVGLDRASHFLTPNTSSGTSIFMSA
jgi:hypothetical protein